MVVGRPGWAVVCPALAARHSSPEMDQAGLPRENGTGAKTMGRAGMEAPLRVLSSSRLGRFHACLEPV